MKTIVTLLLLLSAASVSAFPGIPGGGSSTSPSFGANGFTFVRAVTVAPGKVSGTVNNLNVFVNETKPYLALTSSGGSITDSNGYDIVFTQAADCLKRVDHNKDVYDGTAGLYQGYVSFPQITAGGGGTVYMCGGKSSITTSQESNPWNLNGYRAVWHFGNGSVVETTDSANSNTLGVFDGPPMVAGIAGKAPDFSLWGGGIQDPMAIVGPGDTVNLRLTGDMSVEAVYRAKPTITGVNFTILAKYGSPTSAEWIVFCDPLNGVTYGINGATTPGNNAVSEGTPCLPDVTRHVMGVHGSDGTLKLYINGTLVASSSSADAAITLAGIGVLIGSVNSLPAAAAPMNGWIEEVRISDTARSADWAKASADTLLTSGFYTMGQPQ